MPSRAAHVSSMFRSPLLAKAATVLVSVTGCVPYSPEARCAAYLDCARSVGVPVAEGTIRARGAADIRRLDACRAMPR